MKLLRDRLDHAASASGVPLDVIQKDYALSHVLVGLASQRALVETLVLKGGTALKKYFFGDYRFSEDLDFSTRDAPRGAALEPALDAAMEAATKSLQGYGPFTVEMQRVRHRGPHPKGQEDFAVSVRFPWQTLVGTKIKLEITHDEPVVLEPEPRDLIHEYGEQLAATLPCYRVDEIAAEKLRSLRQTDKKLAERGWNKPRARDYYDLWRVLGAYAGVLEKDAMPALLQKKCAHREVAYKNLDDFFTERLVSEARANWESNLGKFVKNLPPCDQVLNELRGMLTKVLNLT